MAEVANGPRRVDGLLSWFNTGSSSDIQEAGDWPLYVLGKARRREVEACGRIICGRAGCDAQLTYEMFPDLYPELQAPDIPGVYSLKNPCSGGQNCLESADLDV